MIRPRGGFTAHDRYLGWRGSCACGWLGPWRGHSLMTVEEDVMEHWGDCPEREFGEGDGVVDSGPHTRVLPATRQRPGSVAQTGRSEQ